MANNSYEIKTAKDAVQALLGFALIGGIGIPGIIAHFNHVDIAMGEGTEQVKIGTYNCANRTFKPVANTKIAEQTGTKWIDENDMTAAMNGGWIGDALVDGMFDRFDEICDAR